LVLLFCKLASKNTYQKSYSLPSGIIIMRLLDIMKALGNHRRRKEGIKNNAASKRERGSSNNYTNYFEPVSTGSISLRCYHWNN
jgi:hypothetical protein